MMMQTLILLAEGDSQNPGGFGMLTPLILMAAVFWFLVFRPMRRQEQERQKLASSLKKNDDVLTQSGMYGTIVDVCDGEDKITVKIADNVRVKMTRASINRNLTNEEEAAKQAKAAKEAK